MFNHKTHLSEEIRQIRKDGLTSLPEPLPTSQSSFIQQDNDGKMKRFPEEGRCQGSRKKKKKQGRLRGRGHPHKYPQPLRTSHLFTLVFEWGGRKGGGDNVQEAHGQGTGNSWLLLPRPAIESRPQDLLHPQVALTRGPPG